MKKTYSKTGKTCRVTFELPINGETETVELLGDFNEWSPGTTALKKRKGGRFSTTISLPSGEYRFRYLVDGQNWLNDPEADKYVPNNYGSDDSVVII